MVTLAMAMMSPSDSGGVLAENTWPDGSHAGADRVQSGAAQGRCGKPRYRTDYTARIGS